MRILLVSQFFYPEPNSPRGLEFAVELSKRGHDVVAVTAYPSYPDGKLYKGYSQKLYSKDKIRGIELIRLPIYIDHSKSVLKRFMCYCSFALSLLFVLPFKLRGKFDVLFSYCPPITVPLACWLLKYRYRAKMLLDIQDFWPDTLSNAAGQNENSLMYKCIKAVSYFTYSRAEHISVISPGFKSKLLDKDFREDDVSVVYNWSTSNESQINTDAISTIRERLGFVDKFVILFAGNIGQAQSLDHVLFALKKLQKIDPSICFYLYGSGVEKSRLITLAEKLELSNIVFRDRVSLQEINKVQAAADVLFLHLKKTPLFEVTIPSKLSGYLMLGKPIIGGLRGDAKALLENSKSGLTYEPENIDALINAILSIKSKRREELGLMGKNGRNYYYGNIGKSTGVSTYEKIFHILTN